MRLDLTQKSVTRWRVPRAESRRIRGDHAYPAPRNAKARLEGGPVTLIPAEAGDIS
jgi:hypothetical protein